jgi:alkylhydroperoxidase family enzyme
VTHVHTFFSAQTTIFTQKEKTMPLIQTVEPDQAEGKAKEIYDFMQKNAGVIPAPLQLASASPWMLDMVWQSIQYYSRHPNLGFGLLSSIRYLVAQQYDYAFCTGFNRNMLSMQGLSDEDIEKMEKDPLQAPLDDKDRAMVAFVMKAVKTPDDVEKQDVDRLHDLGWTDNDIMDALAHGTNMIGSSILMKTFKMDQAC